MRTAAPWQVKAVDCPTCPDNRAWAVYWHQHLAYPGTRQHMGTFPTHRAAHAAVYVLANCARDGGYVPCAACRSLLNDLTASRRTP